MMRLFPVLFLMVLLVCCKKYKDPAFGYTEPLLHFTIGKTDYDADSVFASIDSVKLDTAKTKSVVTKIQFYKANEKLLYVQLLGKSIGNYDVSAYTYLQYRKPEDGTLFTSTSGKITVWEFDRKDSIVSANFFGVVKDSSGNSLNIENGSFNNVGY